MKSPTGPTAPYAPHPRLPARDPEDETHDDNPAEQALNHKTQWRAKRLGYRRARATVRGLAFRDFKVDVSMGASKSRTSTPRAIANRSSPSTEIFVTQRSSCDTYVRWKSASSAISSWLSPRSLRRHRTFSAIRRRASPTV